MTQPRITFGIIVLNGEPFTRYNLRAIYPFAHEIIVVEGAAPAAASVATPDGHSRDATLAALRRFQADEDPEGKVSIVTAEDEGHSDGFWRGEKDEQSRAYAKRATGDYLWQVDIDEFYRPEDMTKVCAMLRDDPAITGASFHQITFWGGLDYVVDGWFLRRGMSIYHRLFKWGPDYRYATHRPPTVLDDAGRDLRRGKWCGADDMRRRGIELYHYSLLLPKQVEEKCAYYAAAPRFARAGALDWYAEVFLGLRRPFRPHNVYDYPSWLMRFRGAHPPQALAMMSDLKDRKLPVALRQTNDIDRLLNSLAYRLGRQALILLDPVDRGWRRSMSAPKRAAVLCLGAAGAVKRKWEKSVSG
jgi:hypothetical protein